MNETLNRLLLNETRFSDRQLRAESSLTNKNHVCDID